MLGGFREGAGRKAALPGKDLDSPFYMDFTPAGRRALRSLCRAHDLSRNDVIAHLATRHADRLTFADPGVVYPGKLGAQVMRIVMPTDAGDAMRAAHARTGKGYSDLGEALVLEHGARERRWPRRPDGQQVGRTRRGRARKAARRRA